MQAVVKGLRWIAVLPTAFAGWAFAVLLMMFWNWLYLDTASPMFVIMRSTLVPLASCYSFVVFGSKVAPAHREVTAISLSGIVFLLIGISAGIILITPSARTSMPDLLEFVVGCAFSLIGAVVGAFQMYRAVREDFMPASPGEP